MRNNILARKIRPYGLIIALILTSCQEIDLEERAYPSVNTNTVSENDINGVLMVGELLRTGNNSILNHGFVYSTSLVPTHENSDIIDLGPRNSNGLFSTKASRNLETNKEYFFRSYVSFQDGIVYGNILNFVSNSDSFWEVNSCNKFEGSRGDTIIITGAGFSDYSFNNKVNFNSRTSIPYFSTPDSLYVKVPITGQQGENTLSVVLGKNSYTFTTKFIIL